MYPLHCYLPREFLDA